MLMLRSYKVRPLIVVAILFSVTLAGCADRTPGKENGDKSAPKGGMPPGMRDSMRGPNIETAAAAFKPIVLEKQYVGEITPLYTVDLKSTVSGWLRTINYDTGDAVRKNDVICTIENDDIKAQVDQAKAGISVSKSSVSKAEVELERIKLDTDRSEALFAKGYISKQELEQAQSAEKLAKASLIASMGELAQSEAQLKNIEVKLRDSNVKAPFSGVVAERYVDLGAYVSPANPIVRIEDNSKVEAVINVVEDDFARISKGTLTNVIIDSYPDDLFSGRIIRISPSMNKASRTAAVEILLPNIGGKLKSGMTARVNLILAKKPSALVIPESSLRRDVEKDFAYVFIVDKGTVRTRKIVTGIISAGEAEVIVGLKPGDVVVNSDIQISDGMKIGAPRGKGGRR